MVNKLCQLILLICMTCPGMAAADVRFTLKADKKTLALGESLTVELKAEGAGEPLSGINLEQLKQNFNVYGISSNVQTQTRKGRAVTSENMTLILYPLHSGKLQLPALHYMKKSSKALDISVTESSKQTSRVLFKTAIDVPTLQVRQAATLTLEIYDDGTLQWTAPRELLAAGAHLRWLAESQREEMLEGTRYTVHRYAWALMPLREGSLTVEFPLLDALKLGTRLRYPVAGLKLDAAAVPAYLPVHVPIGKLQVSAEALPAEIALDRPVNWKVIIQGNGLSEEGLGKLLTSIHNNAALRFYPPVISKAEHERATTATQTLLLTLTFVPVQAGSVQLPEINLPYYDPASARMASVQLPRAQIKVFNPLWLKLQYIVFGLLPLLSALGLGYWLLQKLRHRLQRRKALLAIVRAVSVDELQRALLHFESDTAAVAYRTLQQWLQHMQQIYSADKRLADVVLQLEHARYGTGETGGNISELAREAALLLKQLSLKKTGMRNALRKLLLPSSLHSSRRT